MVTVCAHGLTRKRDTTWSGLTVTVCAHGLCSLSSIHWHIQVFSKGDGGIPRYVAEQCSVLTCMCNAGGENDWKKLVRRKNLHINHYTSTIDASTYEVSLAPLAYTPVHVRVHAPGQRPFRSRVQHQRSVRNRTYVRVVRRAVRPKFKPNALPTPNAQ